MEGMTPTGWDISVSMSWQASHRRIRDVDSVVIADDSVTEVIPLLAHAPGDNAIALARSPAASSRWLRPHAVCHVPC